MARVRNDDKTQKEKRIFIVQCMGQHVTAYRQEHKMSKAQFARECGVSEGFLRRLECGEANPTLDMIEKLAKFVGMTPAAFLFPPHQRQMNRIPLES